MMPQEASDKIKNRFSQKLVKSLYHKGETWDLLMTRLVGYEGNRSRCMELGKNVCRTSVETKAGKSLRYLQEKADGSNGSQPHSRRVGRSWGETRSGRWRRRGVEMEKNLKH